MSRRVVVKQTNWLAILLVGIILIGIFYAWPSIMSQFQIPGAVPGTSAPSQLVPVTKPIQFSLTDPLNGQAIGGASIYIYGPDKVLKETLTTGSGSGGTILGVATSNLPYQSDSEIWVKVVATNYVTRWFHIVVPKMTQADAQSLAYNYVALQTVNLGTYTIKAVDQFGNVYSSSGSTTIDFSDLGTNTVTLTITVYNTESNSGYVSSYDFLNGINLNAALVTTSNGTAVVVQGAGSYVQRGSTPYWVTILPDDGLTRQLVGQQYVKPGQTSVVITFNKGSLTGVQSFTFSLYDYFDQNYFMTNGIGGPDATSLASLTLNFQP